MSWTCDTFPSWESLLLLVGMGLLAGCGPSEVPQGAVSFPMEWRPVDSLNATLPDGVKVSAGRNDTIPLRAWAVRVTAPHRHPIEVLRSDEPDGVEPVSRFARQKDACVAVNGGYYDPNTDPIQPAGLLVNDGDLGTPPTDTLQRGDRSYPVARGALGIRQDGTVDVAWTTRRADSLLAWSRPPRHSPNVAAPMPPRSAAQPWPVVDAVGAGPVVVAAGTTAVTADAEVFFGTGIPDVHPRTAAGVTEEGALLLVVVDGRQPASRGVDLHELARLMRNLGAVEAVNLDGGGSSTLVVQRHLLNRPTGGTTQREVATAVGVLCHDSVSAR
ncbi:MAG: phosphodiester glycosidase family protein [Salinibacter sp.]|uniref:phosphodiester glycosidase family protein n=1 Tax=Salinibacter sp. TaxID=2065818 RepID=UPI0035D48AB7